MSVLVDYKNLAVSKIENELKQCGDKLHPVYRCVADTLQGFCRQDEEFAKAIYESDKDFNSCMESVLKNKGNCLSDIEAYRRAVRFYFDGADVIFEMRLELCGDSEKSDMILPKKAMILDLFSEF